ncbi:hypothetical protein GC173_02905 [bacterium]|nr:hypothetical protein [bacterium]
MSKIDVVDFDDPSGPGAALPQAQHLSPAPALDLSDYAADMAEFDMTEDQKREFLEILWSIMGHFARLGFSVDVCGLIFGEFNEASAPAGNDGNLEPHSKPENASQSNGGSA